MTMQLDELRLCSGPKQVCNEKTLKLYTTFIFGLVLFVVLVRWLREYLSANASRPSDAFLGRKNEAVLQRLRHLEKPLDWAWFGRPTLGLTMLVAIYLVANATLSSTNLALNWVNHWASRFGWMTAANMVLCVFFGLKNTPLSLVTPVSHSQLNILHRIVGYTAVLFLVLHAVFYTVRYGRLGDWANLVKVENLEGIGAGIAMLVLLMGIFRHRGYELFLVSHVVGFIAALVLAALHRPNWAKKLPAAMMLTGAMWVLDRIIRAVGVLRNLLNNRVTFMPLADGATRLLLEKPGPETALPGSHCFLWIPRIRMFESHPFTIVSNDHSGLELVMKSHRGFTGAVGTFAAANPGRTAWGSVDGSYGSCPDTEKYDKLVLVAGGSGAAFAFGLVNRMLNRCERPKLQSVDFYWAVRRKEHLSWFAKHLRNLAKAGPAINVTLFVTDEPSTSSSHARTGAASQYDARNREETSLLSASKGSCYNAVAGLEETSILRLKEPGLNIRFKKMNVAEIMDKAMGEVQVNQRVLVATCGPRGLMDAVENSVCGWHEKTQDIRLDVHCEDF
ncbi:putative ferric reductase transmembrane component [Colletotrichum sidae]|uniref:ferric-chelate reductase (NADPH) n=1 Tax=Colletotrichum sidae TaxID=1347389 RepID=A0A4V3I2I2_9PEZI|nr:putative ferric reductase transmembrane component [Colletotrichum sidae]